MANIEGSIISWEKKVDFLGTIMIVELLVSCLMEINFGAILYPLDSGQINGLFVLAGVLAVAFGVQQALCLETSTDHRSFPAEFLRQAASRTVSSTHTDVHKIPPYTIKHPVFTFDGYHEGLMPQSMYTGMIQGRNVPYI